MAEQLHQFMGVMVPAVEAEMKALLLLERNTSNHDNSRDVFYGMMQYHLGWLDEDLQPAVNSNGGKRIRPVLCLLSCAAAGGNWEIAVPAGAAVELLHNFTLIHDDIQDSSPLRHGRPTVWRVWGVAQAINSGDSMFALAHLALGRLAERGLPAYSLVRAWRRFDEACLHLTQGQYYDMAFEQRPQVSVDDYLGMIDGKTAALLALCTELGALIAGRDDDVVQHYRLFGRELGLAFQVKDDILGIWGREEHIGKSAATDIATHKKTLPVLYGLSRSEELQELYAGEDGSPAFVERVVRLLDDAGARDFAEEKATHHTHSALAHLEAAGPQGAAGEALYELTNKLLRRQA